MKDVTNPPKDMNTSKSLKDVVWQIYWHGFNRKAAPGTTVPFDPEDYVAAIVEAVEGLYGDSDGLREFASTGSNQVGTPGVFMQEDGGVQFVRLAQSTEGVCQLCNADYVVWFAPNPLWNKVMRHPDGREASEKYAFVCLNCFTKRAEELGVAPTAWELKEAE